MMQFTGKLIDAHLNMSTGKYTVTFEVNESKSVIDGYDKIKDCEKLKVEAVKFRERRSLDANATLWLCIGRIAKALKADKWEIYLQMLKRYGKFTYIVVRENAVEAVKKQWRETEVIGEVKVNGQKAIQMLCYFGSSTYNTAEFSHLLDGVISELKEMGLETPVPAKVKAAMERYEEQWQKG